MVKTYAQKGFRVLLLARVNGEINGEKIDMEILPRKISVCGGIKRVEKFVIPQSFIDMNKHMNSSYYLRLAEDILNDSMETLEMALKI